MASFMGVPNISLLYHCQVFVKKKAAPHLRLFLSRNPRLGNLTSQPAQLRPTAWGRHGPPLVGPDGVRWRPLKFREFGLSECI